MPDPSENRRRYPLIVNPRAKSERGYRAMEFIEAHSHRFEIYRTQSREEAIELTRKFAKAGEDVVITAGGDGTVNAAIEGLAGSSTILGVFPTGTMNVFAREMGIPFDRLEKSMAVIDDGCRKEVDLFEMNGVPFVQMAGVGFDAQVIEATSWESKRRLGPLAYLLAGVRVLRTALPKMTVLTEEGRELRGVCLLIGNGSLYGGHFPLFRTARNTDELLDVVLFKESGFQFIKDSLRGLVKGGIDPLSPGGSVEYLQAARIRVTSAEAIPVEIDGELWGRTQEINFRSTGKKLSVFAPEKPEANRWLNFLRTANPFYRSIGSD
ncbi:MAG: diacylglycerol kinase family lipid kinase [Akkermansiaceae bacterium]|nr:diacylglycerol kinase family lipid kinase [Akkermansiaceae bacterium]